MTYKLELFLVLKKKKKTHKYKINKKLCFIWFIYIGLLVFLHKINSFGIKIKNLD